MQKEFQTRNVAEPARTTNKPRSNHRGFRVHQKQIIAFSIAFNLCVLDQILKWYAMKNDPDWGFGWFKFTLFFNDGIVFSLPVPQWIYLPIALMVFALFVYGLFNAIKNNLPNVFGLSLVVFGALSNIIDRFAHNATIDYLLFFERSAVNLADGMILLGVILFIRSQRTKEVHGGRGH